MSSPGSTLPRWLRWPIRRRGKRIADLGMDIPPPEQQTPAAFAAFHKAEVEKWYPIVKAAGVKAE